MKKTLTHFLLIALLLILAACTATDNTSVTEPVNGSNVYVDNIDVMILESFPVQVNVSVRGNLPNGCVALDEVTSDRDGNTFTLTINASSEGEMCTQAPVPFEEIVSLDVEGLAAGTYVVESGGISAEFTLDIDNG